MKVLFPAKELLGHAAQDPRGGEPEVQVTVEVLHGLRIAVNACVQVLALTLVTANLKRKSREQRGDN